MKRIAVVIAAASSLCHASVIAYTGSAQAYTVPVTGTYEIVAYGAQGAGVYNAGGNGAEMDALFYLTAGTVLNIYVGGQGQAGN